MSGIGTRKMKLEIDGDEYNTESSNIRFSNSDADGDFVTFAKAAEGGGKETHLQGTFVQDAAAASLWTKVYESVGDVITVTLMPYGNAIPSVTEPHFTADVEVADFDGDWLGGDANVSKSARMTFDIDWVCEDKPAKVIAP